MTIQEMKTVKITDKGQIAIPKDIRTGNFKEGSKVAILAYEDHIEIRPLNKINEKMLTTLASERVLKKDWNTKEEDEAWKKL